MKLTVIIPRSCTNLHITIRIRSRAGGVAPDGNAARDGEADGSCGLDESAEISPLRGWTSPGAGYGGSGVSEESVEREDRGRRGREREGGWGRGRAVGVEGDAEETEETNGGEGGAVVIEKILRLLEEKSVQEDVAEGGGQSSGGDLVDAEALCESLEEGERAVHTPMSANDSRDRSAKHRRVAVESSGGGEGGVHGSSGSFAQAVKGLNLISDLLG